MVKADTALDTPASLGPVILCDDEKHIRIAGKQALELEGFEVELFERAEDALKRLEPDWPGVVISDIRMEGMDGMAFLNEALKNDADLPFVLITGHGDVSMAVQAMREGAYDFIEKPFPSEQLVEVVGRAMEKRRLGLEINTLRREVEAQNAPGPKLIGTTPKVQLLRRQVDAIARTSADVLVLGETGTGKEVISRSIHEHSNRRNKNFVAVNCGALPETMIESELFGHEKGAFTGATDKRIGKFEHANGGTLFLDEIESMPLSLQVKLLRVLQERTLERLGSNIPVPLDIRIIAATKVDLKEASARGKFREDLYYRLNVATLEIPPLRERRDDIPLLFRHFVMSTCARYQIDAPPLEADLLGNLMTQDWPGNVRELANTAERYALFGEMEGHGGETGATDQGPSSMTLPQQIDQFEKTLIAQALSRHKGDIKKTHESLGVPRKTLYDKMRKHGLERSAFI